MTDYHEGYGLMRAVLQIAQTLQFESVDDALHAFHVDVSCVENFLQELLKFRPDLGQFIHGHVLESHIDTSL